MSIGPIPFTAIIEYYRIYFNYADMDELDEFIYLIRRMDDTYLELVNAKSKKQGDKAAKSKVRKNERSPKN